MKRHRSQSPRGTVLVAALVCLAIVMAVVGQMLVGAMRASRQMRVERDRRQCELLLQTGLERAALSAPDRAYTGEAWDVAADEIGGSASGQVTIRVSRAEDAPPEIHVLAEYPVGSERSIRRSRTVHLQSTTQPSPEE
jgi:hypothetical protein